ncbi:hypothetical protein HZF24_03595 [Sedimentibacter hydroxybenzoicus DSM 7310]|uniref:DUF5626 domain-containing protein n=1 Tax=Sedimentibacter hydroxybenzoicus DSM 7310 TaxID=1123245 RepID=A0A974BHF2_SEDHY|nr:hypothetical protein [Sedimentibacter hydroxybenzoicus]NYB73218.1 hypothetical protein [Sedimentibacter hydroxybenzoicus DSM 7310]
MIRKTAIIMIILAILLGASNVYAVAGSGNVSDNKDMVIVPFWEHAQKVTPTMYFSSGIYSGQISGNSDVTQISMTVVLSVKNTNGTYSEVSRTSKTENSNFVTKSNTYSFVKGKTYKVTVTGQVYVGTTYENVENSITATY